MSFFFEQLARGAGLIEGVRLNQAPIADLLPAETFEITEEIEVSAPTPSAGQPPPATPAVLPGMSLTGVPAEPVKAEMATAEPYEPTPPAAAMHEPLRPQIAQPVEHASAPNPEQAPDTPLTREVVIEHLFRWIAGTAQHSPATPEASPAPAEFSTPVHNLSVPVPAHTQTPTAEHREDDPALIIQHESRDPSAFPTGASVAPRTTQSTASEEHIELTIGSIHVVVEGPGLAERPRVGAQRRRTAPSTSVPLPPPSLRRYGLLPD